MAGRYAIRACDESADINALVAADLDMAMAIRIIASIDKVLFLARVPETFIVGIEAQDDPEMMSRLSVGKEQ